MLEGLRVFGVKLNCLGIILNRLVQVVIFVVNQASRDECIHVLRG